MAAANPLAIRLSDIELGLVFNPINGLANLQEGTIDEAIEQARLGDVEMNKYDFKKEIFIARLFAKKKGQGGDPFLTPDEIAVIHLYTQDSPFYQILNDRLRGKHRAKLKPFFPILKLLLKALYKLPVFKGTVYRGVKVDLSDQYKANDVRIWWGFSSCSSSLKTMETEVFFGADGERTMFHIKVETGVKIKDYSALSEEEEILLLPGTCLVVNHVLNVTHGVSLIQMTEMENPGLLDFTRASLFPNQAKQQNLEQREQQQQQHKRLIVQKMENMVVREPGNYHDSQLDETIGAKGDCTRIAVANHGNQEMTIEYCLDLLGKPQSPFTSFSMNPERSWITMKTAEGKPVPCLNWTTWLKGS